MTPRKHITNICRSVNIHIRKINSIRRYLSNTAVRTLVQSIVISRLDYCNSICIGLPMNRLRRLQLVQNSAARVISQTKRYTSITPILNELHWLPINKWCQFKILLLTFKSLNGCASEYLCDMLNVYMPNRSLLCPIVLRVLMNMYVNQCLQVRWNSLVSDRFSIASGLKQGGGGCPQYYG